MNLFNVASLALVMFAFGVLVGFHTGEKTKALCPVTQGALAYSISKVNASGDVDSLTCVYVEVPAGQPRRRIEVKPRKEPTV